MKLNMNDNETNASITHKISNIGSDSIILKDYEDSKEFNRISDFEATQHTEIAAEISMPEEGGWGWAVVAASFSCTFILDGIFFTFASMFKDMSADLATDESLVTLLNSVAIALYFITGPIVSALINKLGFRKCAMTGSIIVSLSYAISYFAKNYVILLFTFGIMPGFGGCFIYMSSQLIVGFYFERLRALAMAIAGLGQSFGVIVLSHVNSYLVHLSGWRTTTLLHSGLFGLIYFISMAYRPLLSITVTQTAADDRTVSYLLPLSTQSLEPTVSRKRKVSLVELPTVSERLFKSRSNINFPTAAAIVLQDNESLNSEPGPSTGAVSKYTVTARSPRGGVTQGQLQTSQKDKQIEVTMMTIQEPVDEKKWWKKIFHWGKHVEESRPLYRDDAFYSGTLEKLPLYKKIKIESSQHSASLKYKMAVSRTVAAVDLKERRLFSIAVRRILATMMDLKLLKRRSFLMVCSTGFFTHVGILVPYVFLPDRNRAAGIDPRHCTFFLSVIGFATLIGRIIAGLLVYKFHQPVKIYSMSCLTAGLGIIISIFSYNVYYQYFCCIVFGIAVAHISTLRSLVVVDLYGLDNLTNATGILLMFQGFGTLLSTPLSSVLKGYFGFVVSFCVAGTFILIGGVIFLYVNNIATKELQTKLKSCITDRKPSPNQSSELIVIKI